MRQSRRGSVFLQSGCAVFSPTRFGPEKGLIERFDMSPFKMIEEIIFDVFKIFWPPVAVSLPRDVISCMSVEAIGGRSQARCGEDQEQGQASGSSRPHTSSFIKTRKLYSVASILCCGSRHLLPWGPSRGSLSPNLGGVHVLCRTALPFLRPRVLPFCRCTTFRTEGTVRSSACAVNRS